MSDIMSAGGSFSVVVLGLGGLGVLVTLALAGLAFTKRRVPLFLLVLLPLATAAVGAIGAWLNAGTVLGGIAAVDPGAITMVATEGLYDALAADWFSRWVAAYLFAGATWAAALGAFFTGSDSRMTPIAAGAALLLTVIGAGVLTVYAFVKGIAFSSVTPLLFLLCISGAGVTVAALKRAVYEQAERVAGMRFAASICMLLAVTYGGRALAMGNRMETFGPGGLASQADDLIGAVSLWFDVAAPVANLGWIAFGFAILIALAGFYNELGEVVTKFTLVDVGLTLAMVGALGLVRVVEDIRVDTLADVSTNHPAAVMFEEMGPDLAASLISIDDDVRGVMVEPGGFGDVLVYEDGEWTRQFEWNGGGWYEDDTPLDQVQPSELRPLLVVGSGEEAVDLPALIEGAGGEVLLLVRAHEVKSDVVVPPELAYLQVTFLPLTLSGDEVDLATELWAPAGSRTVNAGVTHWYGEEAEEEPIVYYDAVFAETEAPGIHAVIHERARIKGIVGTCLPAMMTKVDDRAEQNDKWCRLLEAPEGEIEEVRKMAMEANELPEPEHFTASWGRPTDIIADPEVIGGQFIQDRLAHEFGAIDYCLASAKDEGEEVAGRMDLELTFDRKGNVKTALGERSRYESSLGLKCVKDRFSKVEFLIPEDAWPEPPEPEEGEEAEPEEPETLELTLAIRR